MPGRPVDFGHSRVGAYFAGGTCMGIFSFAYYNFLSLLYGPIQTNILSQRARKLKILGGVRVVRWCWVVPARPTILITVGQGPVALAVRAGGSGLDIFTPIYPFSFFSLSLGDGPM